MTHCNCRSQWLPQWHNGQARGPQCLLTSVLGSNHPVSESPPLLRGKPGPFGICIHCLTTAPSHFYSHHSPCLPFLIFHSSILLIDGCVSITANIHIKTLWPLCRFFSVLSRALLLTRMLLQLNTHNPWGLPPVGQGVCRATWQTRPILLALKLPNDK